MRIARGVMEMRGDEVEENYPRSKPHGKADGLLSRWLSRLLRSDDLEREKKRLLRRVERRLRKGQGARLDPTLGLEPR